MIILHCKVHTLGFNGKVLLCSKTDKYKQPMRPLKVTASHFQNIFNDSKWWRYWRRFDLWTEKIPLRRKWQPTSIFLLGKSHGQRSLVGCSPWGHTESDTTEVTKHSTLGRICLYHLGSLRKVELKIGIVRILAVVSLYLQQISM